MSDSLQTEVWADIANKALDLTSGAISEVVAQAKEVAPDLWRITAEKLWAEALANLMIIIPAIALIVIFKKP